MEIPVTVCKTVPTVASILFVSCLLSNLTYCSDYQNSIYLLLAKHLQVIMA